MEYASFGDHPAECFQDPGLAKCANGVTVMVCVYLREHANQIIATSLLNGAMRGFAISVVQKKFVCQFHQSDTSFLTYVGFEAALNSMFITQSTWFKSKQ